MAGVAGVAELGGIPLGRLGGMVDPWLALAHQAAGPRGESAWQLEARLLQSLWRQRARLAPASDHPRDGVCLTPADGAAMRNFLTPAARRTAEATRPWAPGGSAKERHAREQQLLSTQTMCHNLFGPLAERPEDPRTAEALRLLEPDIEQVERVAFDVEVKPGAAGFIGRPASFHVLVDFRDAKQRPRSLAIKARYGEAHAGGALVLPTEAATLMRRSGVFGRLDPGDMPPRCNSLLREHLVTIAMSHYARRRTRFVYVYPVRHEKSVQAVSVYREFLRESAKFGAHTFEEIIAALRWSYGQKWVEDVWARYLDPAPLRRAAAAGPPSGAPS